jgi:hypothetical protein
MDGTDAQLALMYAKRHNMHALIELKLTEPGSVQLWGFMYAWMRSSS